jgi:hypothetical protein
VVAQRSLEKAREDAGVNELNAQALTFVIVVTFAALVLGYLFAVGISTPIRALVKLPRAPSAAANFNSAPPCMAPRKSANWPKRSITWPTTSKVYRPAEAGRRRKPRAVPRLHPHARRGHRRKGPLHARPFRPRRQILGAHRTATRPGRPEELDCLRIAALLHDVGKIGVDDRVLKKPGALTDEEFEVMKQHPIKGANIMRPVAQLKDMLPGIELHHEHVNGGGYPYGLKGDDIPLMARIIAVADTSTP